LRQADNRGRTIYVECTCTYLYGGNSGIQRVVRNIVNNCKQVGEELGIRCQPIISTGNSFVEIDGIGLRGRMFYTLGTGAWGVINSPDRRRFRFPPLDVLMNSPLVGEIRAFILRRLKLIGEHFSRLVSRCSHRVVDMREGDILLLLDSSWHVPLWGAVRLAKEKLAKVGIVVYDLIPVRMPEHCDRQLVKVFRDWLSKASDCADFFLTISDAVKTELTKLLTSQHGRGVDVNSRVRSFRLGANLDQAHPEGRIRKGLVDIFEKHGNGKPYLMVSTIEPRKNHEFVLDAFDRVWREGIDVRLMIVGKIGWLCSGILKRIRKHARRQKQLFMFNDLNDAELSYCYEKARALVFASKYEGFGLPIIEALHKGLVVMASDIPVHREVGRDYCRYFGLDSPLSLAKMIIDCETGGTSPPTKTPGDFTWPNWRQSCRELVTHVASISETH
jgi:glycosyltransferase involved in cell wall biosynthesis